MPVAVFETNLILLSYQWQHYQPVKSKILLTRDSLKLKMHFPKNLPRSVELFYGMPLNASPTIHEHGHVPLSG